MIIQNFLSFDDVRLHVCKILAKLRTHVVIIRFHSYGTVTDLF